MSSHYLTTPPEGKTFIYRSSAGSGKTFTLTKAYLKLVLLDTSRYHQVLAITFTNDAKNEMKNRILEELTLLANGENSDMRKAILADFKEEKVVNIEEVITSRAKTVLNSLLHDYSRFNVSTIDHFFSQLIRHLAKELKLNLSYELDIDNKKAMNESIQLLFSGADKKTLSWLKEFALNQLDEDKGWDIRRNIASLGNKLFQESYLDIEELLAANAGRLDSFIKALKQTVQDFKQKAIALGKKGIETAQKHGLEKSDFNRGMPYGQMEQFASGNYNYGKPPSPTFLNALTLDTWHTKTSTKVEVIAQARDEGMKAAHEGLVKLYTGKDFSQYIEAQAILYYIHAYGVLASLSEKLHEYRDTNNLILISDTAFILNKVIRDVEIPFIYEKINAKYQYILIDEFQDTSFYQWKSLLPFFKAALADGGQLFIVGDVKQSIYSWRGGDMRLLLHQVEKDIEVDEKNIRSLATNYRSARNVIAFNNAFFTLAPDFITTAHELEDYLPEVKKAYADVVQQWTKPYDGYVKVQFLDNEVAPWKEQAREQMLAEINQSLADNFTLNDILILTRKTDEASEIGRFLLENNINAISEEALLVTSSPKVQLIISALKYLKNTQNVLAIAEFNHFHTLVFGTRPEAPGQLPAQLRSLQKLSKHPIYELIEELILQLDIPFAGDIYLQQLLDICFLQTKKGVATVSAFIDWWQEETGNDNSKVMAVALPGTEEAVKIMTIHKAKGLEYPVVILPYADSSMAPMTNSIFWAKPLPEPYESWGSLPLRFVKNLADTRFKGVYYEEYFRNTLEALNLLYVAFTRAAERLYLFSNLKAKATSSGHLLYSVITSPDFTFKANFDEATNTFILGALAAKEAAVKPQKINTRPLAARSSAIADKLVIDQQKSRLFLTVNSEKSAKVKEGIAMHKALSMMKDIADLDAVVQNMVAGNTIDPTMGKSLKAKISTLFEKIPEFNDWFGGDYEVINEHQIIAHGKIFIPDRVMVRGNKAIIIDYKREQKDPKHHQQIKQYGQLLQTMGYNPIAMYLIYIDDQTLVKVA